MKNLHWIQFGILPSWLLRSFLALFLLGTLFLQIELLRGSQIYAGSYFSPHPTSVTSDLAQSDIAANGNVNTATTLISSESLSATFDSWGEANLVITEIHHSPDNFDQNFEFIELYNDGEDAVNLNGWALDGAVYYLFSDDVIVEPSQYTVIAENPGAIRQFWKVDASGPYSGRLDGAGEEVILRKPNAQIADSVDYGLGFPWPTVGDSPSQSINLLYAGLDNSRAGNWRSAAPSPGDPNATANSNPPPLVEAVGHSPTQPRTGEPVQIVATVADPDGVASVILEYQVVKPGEFITIASPEFRENWTPITMEATGTQNDVGEIYRALIPPSIQKHRHLIRYRIRTTDGSAQTGLVPYADDPQPNFAYFTYDAVPPWTGAIKPLRPGTEDGVFQTYDFAAMRPMAVYHLITRAEDFRDALTESGYEGSGYPWHGALVYNGRVYDHIRYRARGGVWRYALGKNHPKIDFNRGHDFQAYDDYGQAYSSTWRKLNLSSVIQQGERLHRGEQGLFESTGFRLFNLAGVEAPKTHFVHFRAIMREDEIPAKYDGSAQYDTDFQGLYLAIEQMDGRFLEEHDLPDGNLYKMEGGFGELNNRGAGAVLDLSDLRAFLNGYELDGPSEEWWRTHVDMDRFYSYRTIIEAIHHYDINKQKNYFYFNNPQTELWQVHPWDIDQTWADNMFGSGYEDLLRAGILRHPTNDVEYQNRVREVLDLLFNNEQTWLLLDEQASLINTSSSGASMVDADRAMWDNNSLMSGKHVEDRKAGKERFYESSPTGDFAGMVDLMKLWVISRGEWMRDELISDEDEIPYTPGAQYVGSAGYPADDLRFSHAGYNDPQGVDTVVAMEWRIAPIHWPGVVGYDSSVRNRYEIESTWESGPLSPDEKEVLIPQGACLPGQTCRVRVRMQDSTGYWSHWSAPVEFVPGEPALRAIDTLIPTELMFNAGSRGPIPGEELDFIELKNISNQPIDLSAMSFSDGIDFIFPRNTVLEPRGFLVLTEDRERFEFAYGFTPFGQYEGQLTDAGETIQLNDVFGRTVFTLDYETDPPWPLLANGQGHSAVLSEPGTVDTEIQDPHVWRASANVGGSPGADDPVDVVINEVLANPLSGRPSVIELWNNSQYYGSIGGWYLTTDRSQPRQYRIPSETSLGADEYWTVHNGIFNLSSNNQTGLTLNPAGGALTLFSANELGRLTGYEHSFTYAATPPGLSTGRLINPMGEEDFVLQQLLTLGDKNSDPVVGPLVFSKLNFRPNVGQEFVEITNISSSPVVLTDPAAPENRWSVGGIHYQFPLGLTIPPNGRVLLIPSTPRNFCQTETYLHIASDVMESTLTSASGPVRVLGPFVGALQDNGGMISLSRPAVLDAQAEPVQMPVERITYSVNPPWPSIGFGTEDFMLTRLNDGYGNDPANWQKEAVVHSSSGLYPLSICSFDATVNEANNETTIEWTVLAESGVSGYHLWQFEVNDAQPPQRLTKKPIPVSTAQSNVTPSDSQSSAQAVIPYLYTVNSTEGPLPSAATTYYQLEAVGPDGAVIDTAITSPLNNLQLIYLPVTQ